MPEKKFKKNTIWIYAITLFICAFIVLLLTLYSQIKFNKNIDSKLSDSEKEKYKVQYNANKLIDENKKLNEQIDTYQKDIATYKKNISEKESKISDLTKKLTETSSMYDILSKAEDYYKNGDILMCASLITNNFKSDLLMENGLNKFRFLSGKTFKNASYIAYKEGYKNYQQSNYENAIKNFSLSLQIENKEYYSDDCYFFIAYSAYKNGNIELAKKTINTFMENYPDSEYKDDLVYLNTQLK